MGILTIQFGQCGNQIGHALFDYLLHDINDTKASVSKSNNIEYTVAAKNQWFSEYKNTCYVPRSILVDTESKVVSSIIKNDKLRFNNNRIVANNGSGSANNWAFGYTEKADALLEELVNIVRQEIENADEVTTILSILSSGGGTGSGLGSRVLEILRSEFPNKSIINVIVFPYNNGEIVTQNYNTLLTLAKLYETTDGSILLQNDYLHKICNSMLAIKNVNLHDINKVIAHKICAVLQPAISYSIHDFTYLTSHPNYKFLQLETTPHIPTENLKFESLPTWSALSGHLFKMFRAKKHVLEGSSNSNHPQLPIRPYKSGGSLLISRGGVAPQVNDISILCDKELFPGWLGDDGLKNFNQTRPLYETKRLLALASNSNLILNTIDPIIDNAWTLFKHRAYLHQYSKYDINEADFELAFEKLESIISNYRDM